MRCRSAVFRLGLLAGALGAATFAGADPPPPTPSDVEQPQLAAQGLVQGRLATLGRDALLIDRVDATSVQLRVQDSTQIVFEGRRVTLTELPPGADVRAAYVVDDGVPTATRIEAELPSGPRP